MLLKTLTEFQAYVAVDFNVNTGLPPGFVLELAETEASLIAPLLSEPLCAWLQAAYDSPDFDATALTPVAGLLRAVQAPLARLAASSGITTHQVKIDGTGLHIVSTDKIKTAFQWQSRELQALHQRRGYAGLDALVQWLEDHRTDSPELEAWAASPAGRRHRRELFTSATAFQEYENIGSSWLVFEALRPIRRRLQALELRGVLGDEFLQELLDQVATRTLTSENENLLRSRVYPALASLTIAHAVPTMTLRLTASGIDLALQRPDDGNAKEGEGGLSELLRQLGQDALAVGERYLRQLSDHLDSRASPTAFATYYHSPAYTPPAKQAPVRNTATSKVLRFC
jgi:hypothetical protein